MGSMLFALLILLVGFIAISDARTPTLVISLDGFRSSYFEAYLREHPDSNLKKFVSSGVKAEYMIPIFPTNTYPNHMTMVTGLYPESHGVVDNEFYDEVYNIRMDLFNSPNQLEVQWWNKTEPIWLTARNQGLKTAGFFWKGTDVWTRNPDIWVAKNLNYTFKERLNEIFNWFTKFHLDLCLVHFNFPDQPSHAYGLDTKGFNDSINTIDETVGYLMNKAKELKLNDKMNVIILSDHGMVNFLKNQTLLVQGELLSMIDTNKTTFGVPAYIFPKDMANLGKIYDGLKKLPNLTVYYKNEIPERYHFRNDRRIAPIVVVADEGYVVDSSIKSYISDHGFDNSLESMRSIFMASGPDFKVNTVIQPFSVINIYALLCDLIDLKCLPNNGTLSVFKNALTSSNEDQFSASIRISPAWSFFVLITAMVLNRMLFN